MQVLISTKTATSKCQHRRRQPFVDRNRCVAGTTSICGVRRPPPAITPLPQSPDEPTMFATSCNARMRQQHDWCLRPIDTTSLPVAAAASSERRPLRGWQSMTQSCPRNFLRATARMSCKRFSTPVDQFNWFAFAAGAGDIRAYEAVFPRADMSEAAALRISKP